MLTRGREARKGPVYDSVRARLRSIPAAEQPSPNGRASFPGVWGRLGVRKGRVPAVLLHRDTLERSVDG